MKKCILLMAFLGCFTAEGLRADENRFNVSVQPVKMLFGRLNASLEYKVTPRLSLFIPATLYVDSVPVWSNNGGWKFQVASGMNFKMHITGEALEGGFYIAPGVGLGWRNHINEYEKWVVQFLSANRIGAFVLNRQFDNKRSFVYVDMRLQVGYDWFFANNFSLDLSAGMAVSNVFATVKNGGFYYVLPVPVSEFSVGFRF